MTKLDEDNWMDIYLFLLAIVVVSLFSMIMVAITATHKVESYYLRVGEGTTCIVGYRNWAQDITAACYANADDAIKALKEIRNVH